MKKQAAFVLLSLLYLASTLATIQAVKYIGPEEVREGQSWVIECNGLKPAEKIQWTKDDQPIPALATGIMSVHNYEGSSKLVSRVSSESQSGSYKCTPDNNATFTLLIKSGSTIKVFVESDKTLNLTCDGYSSGDFEWMKDDQNIDTVVASNKDPKTFAEYIKKGENGMLLLKYHDSVYGKYKCNTTSGNNTTEIKLVKPPIVLPMENKSVVEGEILEVLCTFNQVEAEDVIIIWEFNGTEYDMSKDRITLEDSNTTDGRKIAHARFILKSVQIADRGFVTCKAAYNWPDIEEHMSIAKVHFRVKDKLAALWPFLGICAEVVVLCAIILIYEKKRNKAELEESDTDQSPDTETSEQVSVESCQSQNSMASKKVKFSTSSSSSRASDVFLTTPTDYRPDNNSLPLT